MKTLWTTMALAAIVSATGCEQPSSVRVPEDRTNTSINERDRNSDLKTPVDQNENKADIDVTSRIRKRIVSSQMSVNATNVKIITQDGEVTLRGPVPTEDERNKILAIAEEVAGKDKVHNQLELEKIQ